MGATVTWSLMDTGIGLDAGVSSALGVFMPVGFETEIALAFDAWSTVADITFIEVADFGEDFNAPQLSGDLRLAGHIFDGPNGFLAHGFFPPVNGDSAAGDITASLGKLRERLEPVLRQAGIKIRWRVTDLPSVHRFGSEHYLHILRICQEAMTNVLKHSGASVITVATGVETDSQGQDRVAIRISDDGTGISTEPENGNGIRNMRFRAGALDGELRIAPLDEGTEVSLRFPVSLD
jgi:hypothetical protein